MLRSGFLLIVLMPGLPHFAPSRSPAAHELIDGLENNAVATQAKSSIPEVFFGKGIDMVKNIKWPVNAHTLKPRYVLEVANSEQIIVHVGKTGYFRIPAEDTYLFQEDGRLTRIHMVFGNMPSFHSARNQLSRWCQAFQIHEKSRIWSKLKEWGQIAPDKDKDLKYGVRGGALLDINVSVFFEIRPSFRSIEDIGKKPTMWLFTITLSHADCEELKGYDPAVWEALNKK